MDSARRWKERWEMNGVEHVNRPLTQIAAEHRNLQRRASRLVRAAREPLAEQNFAVVREQLTAEVVELRDLFKGHLAREEAGGYLEEAVARVPRLAHEADSVEQQHPGLLAEMAALIETIKAAKPSPSDWAAISRAVVAFAGKLLAHEAAENHILQEGFNADPALFDIEIGR
jgi:Hemerythrin HHE cation binding domain